jgi:membrane associated rhomboid family serine protease
MEISVTLVIIIITSIVSIGAFNDQRLTDKLIFYPPSVNRGQFYRFFSCGIIHADWGHLIFNMLSLYLFGIGRVETAIGPVNMGVEYNFIAIFGEKGRYLYLGMYVLALMASLLPTYLKNKDNYHYRSLGASGAVSAVIFAGILLKPLTGMGLFFIPVYVAGFIFGLIYLAVSSWLDKRGSDNINHSAHIFGALFGVGITIILCMAVANYPVLEAFVEQIKNTSPSDWIQFGSN